MFLHVVADALGSLGVIVSSILISLFGWTAADPLCSIFIALLILVSIWGLLVKSTETLLQRTPRSIEKKLPGILSKV
jgi:zinc transporter 5/7